MRSSLSLLALLGAAAAQNVVNLILPNTDSQALVGEIIGVTAIATTYVIQCANTSSSDQCGFEGPFTLIEGPSTLSFGISASQTDGGFSAAVSCVIAGSPVTAATCTQSLVDTNGTSVSTTTYASADLTDLPTIPVTITATAAGIGGGSASGMVTQTGTGMITGMTTTTMTGSSMGTAAGTATGVTTGSSTGSSTGTAAQSSTSVTKSSAEGLGRAGMMGWGAVAGGLLAVGML
ncbi:hypothetical protein MMC13_003464 [Lambiella insularis]|nr:hypothetical protein [Lambiella insularis]